MVEEPPVSREVSLPSSVLQRRKFREALPAHNGALILGLLIFFASAGPAQGVGAFPHALHVSMDETRLEVHTMEGPSAIRTFFLEAPRRFAVDLEFPSGPPAAADAVIPVSLDPRIEKITITRHPRHVRYTFFVKRGASARYRVERHASTVSLVVQSEVLGTAPMLPGKAMLQGGAEVPDIASKSDPGLLGDPSSSDGLHVSIRDHRAPTTDPAPRDSYGHPAGGADTVAPERPEAAPPVQPTGGSAMAQNPHHPETSTVEKAPEAVRDAVGPVVHLFAEGNAPQREDKGGREKFRIRGFVEATGGSDLAREDPFEHTQSFRNRIRLETKLPLTAPLEKSHLLVSGESDFLWFGPNRDWNDDDFSLYETYFQGSQGPWEFRLGRQIVRWGKTDQLSPVDNLNPQDLRQFVVPTLEEQKIPNWMALVRFFRQPFSLEAVAIPFFEPLEIDVFGTDWAVFRHTREVLKEAPLPLPLREAAASVGTDRTEPSRTFRNAQWGLRTGFTAGGWDMAASYLYGWNPMPLIKSFPVKGIRTDGSFDPDDILHVASQGMFVPGDVAIGYHRTHTVGVEWETVLGNYGFRGETALTSHAVFLTSDLTSVTQRVLFSVVGIDRTWANDWYANLQLGHQVLLDYDDSVLYFKRHNLSVNGEIRKDFLRGDLEARLRGLVLLTDGGSLWNPSVTYRRFAPLSITTGLNLFAGPSDTFLGTYSHNDQAYVTVRYDF